MPFPRVIYSTLLVLGSLMSAPDAADGQTGLETPSPLEAFPPRAVRLEEGPCRRAREANRGYLHQLDADRLLYNFRRNAGLDAPGKPLGGWERPDCELRGHFTGHFLSACALLAAATEDKVLETKANSMVRELARCQQALGGGYLSAFPESFLDRLERRENVPWAPLYTIHKIMAGLDDVYHLLGNEQALEMLEKMAAYLTRRAQPMTDFQFERMLTTEFGGLSEVLHNLYAVTRDPTHLALANRYDQAAFLGPLALGRDNLTGLHGNTQIPKICGAARRYELTGEAIYRRTTELFWDLVANTRSYATGGTTSGEHWPEPNALAGTLSATNQECCKTHNMLKVTRYLFRWTGDPRYADFYERAFFNGILGTQRESDGMLMYYVPLATGSTKLFGTPDDSFWCCYGTGVESFAKLGDSIYFHDDEALYVNLYIASTLAWKEKGLLLRQETRFPEEEGTSLRMHLTEPTRFRLRLHVPYWATRGVAVTINGQSVSVEARPTSFLNLERTWKDGDLVRVTMPMALHASPMPDDPEMVAVMYGPVVLAGLHPPAEPLFLADPNTPAEWITKRPDEPLTFTTRGQTTEMTLVPLNRVTDEPYGVYWIVTHPASARHRAILAAREARRRREARIVDRVLIGDATSEEAHALQGEQTSSGRLGSRPWRHAVGGGWWSWALEVTPDQPMILACTYWGSDAGGREFDILIDGTKIATEVLDRDDPGRFVETEYRLPIALTRGRSKITVRFQAHPDRWAGGVFDCTTLRAPSAAPGDEGSAGPPRTP